MVKLESVAHDLRRLDELAAQKTVIHRLDPLSKLLTTLVFIVTVASFHKYDVTGLLPMVLFPVVLQNLSELPARYLLQRMLIAAPFVFFIGVFNPLFDHLPLIQVGSVIISGGWVSFVSIMIRFALSVIAALILIATSGFDEVCAALFRLKIPRAFVVQLLFMYRYLSVLIEETARMVRAHSLRSIPGQGIQYKIWGSLVGQLLLRTIDRAERIYQAMLCRGFTGEIRLMRSNKTRPSDIIYFLGWSCFFVIVRLYNIPQFLGSLLTGVGK
jgi:cobalt/nickel transport system permease protein